MELPQSMLHYLASSIVAPRCHAIWASIKLNTIEQPGSTFAKFAKIPLQAPDFRMTVKYLQDGIMVELYSTAEGHYAERWEFDEANWFNKITIEMEYDLDKWAFLIQALALPVTTSKILLSCDANPKDPQGQSLTKPEHFTFWSSACQIQFYWEYPDTLTVLEYLRVPSVVDGEEHWACPKLKGIGLFQSEMDTDVVAKILIEILERRHLASKREGAATHVQPLSRVEASSPICGIVKKSQYAEGIYFDRIR